LEWHSFWGKVRLGAYLPGDVRSDGGGNLGMEKY
jgi:hypothetical protein